MLYATGYVTGYVYFIAYTSCLKILKSSICHAGTQKHVAVQHKRSTTRYLLIPRLRLVTANGTRKKKNSTNPSRQTLGIRKSTFHQPFTPDFLHAQSDAASHCEGCTWLLCLLRYCCQS